MATSDISIGAKLQRIQCELKAPKNLFNKFGNYYYRNAEGIQEALKPLLSKYEAYVTLNDEPVIIGSRTYIKATAELKDAATGDAVAVTAYAREADTKKGMDDAQVTGATSSYARKYALNGLFLLDDTKDADTDEYHEQTTKATAKPAPAPKAEAKPVTLVCDKCGKPISAHGKASAKAIAEASKKQFGLQLCYDCGRAEKEARTNAAKVEIDESVGLPFPIE